MKKSIEEMRKMEKSCRIDIFNECGICLEPLTDRGIRPFPCMKHAVHKDCYE